MIMSPLPLISVITVCYNAEKYIEETIQSVSRQTYPHIEYIIVDGLSKDGTLQIVEKYRSVIHQVISEKDKGIYDAMNKGLRLATGDYVIFMNAGDIFYNDEILQQTFAAGDEYDVYFGDTLFVNDAGEPLALMSEVRNRKLPDTIDWKCMKYGMLVGHQSIFVRRSIAPQFDLAHPSSGDIDWIIRALKQTNKTKNTGLVISRFRMGGFSQQYLVRSLKDRYRVLKKHYGWLPNLFHHFVIFLKTFGKKRIKV